MNEGNRGRKTRGTHAVPSLGLLPLLRSSSVVARSLKSEESIEGIVAHRARVVALLAFSLAGAGLAFAGAMPEGYATVGDVVAGSAHGHSDRVTVKATVAEGSLERGNATRFVLTDGATELPVVWTKALPDDEMGGSIEGKTVVLTGSVVMEDGKPVLHGETMQVGCASKYERLGKEGVGENPA